MNPHQNTPIYPIPADLDLARLIEQMAKTLQAEIGGLPTANNPHYNIIAIELGEAIDHLTRAANKLSKVP